MRCTSSDWRLMQPYQQRHLPPSAQTQQCNTHLSAWEVKDFEAVTVRDLPSLHAHEVVLDSAIAIRLLDISVLEPHELAAVRQSNLDGAIGEENLRPGRREVG